MVESLNEKLRDLETDSRKDGKSGASAASKTLARSELSLDINEILSLDFDEPPSALKLSKSDRLNKVKCCPIFIGGVDLPVGCGLLTCPRTCSVLHCRDCDFSVRSFPNHEWTEDVDYLFLRVNMPNIKRVSEKLKRKVGAVAYACQCVSFSTDKVLLLHEQGLPWFCRGHV